MELRTCSKPVSSLKHRTRAQRDPQPSVKELNELGIKVRDFAYEKTNLAPVRTVYRHPPQIQPSATPLNEPSARILKHKRTETDEGGLRTRSQTDQSMIPLEKTEPVISPGLAPLAHEPAYLNSDRQMGEQVRT